MEGGDDPFQQHLSILNQSQDPKLFHVHNKNMTFNAKSFGLDNKSPFRFKVVRFVTAKAFERFIMILILIYSVLLGMKDYINDEAPVNQLIHGVDIYFNLIVYAEFVLKCIAMGFTSYLSDGWNWIDFFVVLSSATQEVITLLDLNKGGASLSALRAFRLLRPLKLLTSIPSLKMLFGTLISSVKSLGNILGLAVFFFTIFSILGVSLWQGKIHYRCYDTPEPVDGEWKLTDGIIKLCSDDYTQCPAGSYCRSRFEAYNSDGTPYKFKDENLWVDTDFAPFNFGITQFDNILNAFLTIFIVSTRDTWTPIMQMHQDIFQPVFVRFYFISVVWICGFFILNMTIATMLMKYDEIGQENDDGPDQFETELRQLGERIFGPNKALGEFIISQPNVEIDAGAKRHMCKEKTFLQKFFSRKEYKVENPESRYNKNAIVKFCMTVIQHPLFDSSIMIVIILNTICLALDGYPSFDEQVLDFLEILNLVFTIIFTFEVIFKMIALGVREFMKEGFNIFDLFIVATSLAQIAYQSMVHNAQNSGFFLIFRTFRVFRVFKLFKSGDLRMLVDSIIFTISTIGPYFTFLMFFVYIFALVGMSLYAGKIKFDSDGNVDQVFGTSPRENFDTLGNTLISLFIIIIGSWSAIMMNAVRCTNGASAIYFVLIFIMSVIILINLFLAIMLGNFEKAKVYGQKKKILEAFDELMNKHNYSIINACDVILGELSEHVVDQVLKIERPVLDLGKIQVVGKGSSIYSKYKDPFEDEIAKGDKSLFIFDIDSQFRRKCLRLAEDQAKVEQIFRRRHEKVRPINDDEDHEDQVPFIAEHYDSHPNKTFDKIILVLILISSGLLPFDNPLNDPHSTKSKVIFYLNTGFTLCFIVEMSIKVIALGLVHNNFGDVKPYLSSGWNKVDAFVVTISTLDLILVLIGGGSSFAALKALRALRALRPLRVIKRFENLSIIVNALFSTFGALQNVLMVGAILLLIFSIMGVSFFNGKFYYCSISSSEIFTKEDCLKEGGEWVNPYMNFDNSLRGMGTLFLMMQTENWVDMMYRGMDSTEIGQVPQMNASPYFSIYFVLFMVTGYMFIMNLFVAVVLQQFNRNQQKNELGSVFVTDSQRQWILMQQIGQRVTLKKMNKEPEGCRKSFHKLVHHKFFENFITFIIIFNVVCMAIVHYQMEPELEKGLTELNRFFSMVFNIEMFLKLIALKGDYFRSNWNLFDMFIVISSDVGIILDMIGMNKNMSTAVTILRAFRILRIVRLLKTFDSIRVIVQAVILIFPSIINILALFALALYIFACVGINLFSGTKSGAFIDDKNNFQSFTGAMLVLMRFSTGESWSFFMYEYANTENCLHNQTYEGIKTDGLQGCGTSLSYVYFITFRIIVAMLVLNLVIAAVINGLSEAQADDQRLIRNDDIDFLMDTWAYYDNDGLGKISIVNVIFFIMDLRPPFMHQEHLKIPIQGVWDSINQSNYLINQPRGYCLKLGSLFKIIKEYKLHAHKDSDGKYFVYFNTIYKTLVKKAFETTLQSDEFEIKNENIKKKLKKSWKEDIRGDRNAEIIMQHIAATLMQRKFKQRLARLSEKTQDEDKFHSMK